VTSNYFSLGYNEPDSESLIPVTFRINGHEYSNELGLQEQISLTKWWNPETITQIDCLFDIDIKEIFAQCNLNSSDELFLTVYSYSSGTKLMHQGEIIPIHDSQVAAQIIIPEFELAQSLDLYGAIICRFSTEFPRKVGAPFIQNSRLLKRSWRFSLAGSHTQVNVFYEDFSSDPMTSLSAWKIEIDDPQDYESWLLAQHSIVLKVVINQNLQDFVKQDGVQALLMTDLVLLALDSSIDDDERLSFLQSDSVPEGTWAQFLKKYFDLIFNRQHFGIREYWHSDQSEIRNRVQHLMRGNLELK
jgi:hypothetical protein